MTTYPLKDAVRVTYELEYPWKELHLNVSGKCASELYPRDWWERRKKETGDPTGRKTMEEAFAITVMCPILLSVSRSTSIPSVTSVEIATFTGTEKNV